jgi:hypothetical protein
MVEVFSNAPKYFSKRFKCPLHLIHRATCFMEFSNDTKVSMDSVIVLPVRVEALESEYAACPLGGELKFAFEPEQQEHSQASVVGGVVEKARDLESKHIYLFTNDEEPQPKLGKSIKFKKSESRNLFHPILDYRDEWFAFSSIANVTFSNNQAERDFYYLKTKQEVATNLQTLKGEQHCVLHQFFTSTFHEHSMNIFQHMINALDRKYVVFQAG